MDKTHRKSVALAVVFGAMAGWFAPPHAQLAAADVADQLKSSGASEVNLPRDAQNRVFGQFHITGDLGKPKLTAAAKSSPGKDSVKAGEALSSEAAQRIFEQFVEQNRQLFGLDRPGATLRLARARGDQFGMFHLRYHRYADGVRVADMEVLAHIGADGSLQHISGHLTHPSQEALLTLRTSGAPIALEQARALAAAHLEVPVSGIDFLSEELLVTNRPPHLVWQLDSRLTNARLGRFVLQVDAINGQVVSVRDELQRLR